MELPEFDRPPVVEVALAVQFDDLPTIEVAHFGLFWANHLRDRLPVTATQPPLPQRTETFGVIPPMGVSFEIVDGPPKPRCWFSDESRAELVQVQTDRFVHNWRKAGDEQTYPRYDNIRARFKTDLEKFVGFLHDSALGSLVANQCEVTYVNHIVSGEGWTDHADAGNVFSFVAQQPEMAFLPKPEAIDHSVRFVITDGGDERIGRLHVSARSGFRTQDKAPMFALTLTARGKPTGGKGIDDVLGFLDTAREWVVRGFTDATTPEMHRIWRRTR